MQALPDGVFNYASAVLNDGLLLMELRDAIHEGDGETILRTRIAKIGLKMCLLYLPFLNTVDFINSKVRIQFHRMAV